MNTEDDTLTAEGWGDDTRLVDSTEPAREGQASHSAQDSLQRCSGHNILLQLGAELLALIALMPRLQPPESPARLREQIQGQLLRLRSEGSFMVCHPWALENCGLVLSAAVDEAVLKTEWGRGSGWANDTLLSRIYGLRNGGELFFELLEQARIQPDLLAPFLELQYVLLQLGFTGRYHGQPAVRDTLCAELFTLVQRVAPGHPLGFRPVPALCDQRPLPLFRFGRISLWGLVFMALLFLLGGHLNGLTAREQSWRFQQIFEQRFVTPVRESRASTTEPAPAQSSGAGP